MPEPDDQDVRGGAVAVIPLPPPPAMLVLVVDVFRLQDPEAIPRMRQRLREVGYDTVLILGQTAGVQVAHRVPPVQPRAAEEVGCPATPPHDACVLCQGTGRVTAW